MTFLNCNSDWSMLVRKIFRISPVNSTQNQILLCIRTKITWDFCVDVFVDCIDSSNNLIPGSSLYLAVERELWKRGCPFCRVTCLSIDKARDFVSDGFPKNRHITVATTIVNHLTPQPWFLTDCKFFGYVFEICQKHFLFLSPLTLLALVIVSFFWRNDSLVKET